MLIVVALAEFALRALERPMAHRLQFLASHLRVPHCAKHHALKPLDENYREQGGRGSVYYATNSLGMRDHGPTNLRLTNCGEYRILFLGDSFTEGLGVRYEDTVVDQVERRLDDSHWSARPVRCLNAGIASYAPLLEYLHLIDLMQQGLQFDRVVLLIDPSDPQDEIVYHRHLDSHGISVSAQLASGSPFHSRMFTTVYSYSALFRLGWRGWRGITWEQMWRDGYHQDREFWTDDDDLIRLWGVRGIKLMLADIGRIADELGRRNVPFDVVIYPWPYQIVSERDPCIFEKKLVELCRDREIRLVNLFDDFRSRRDWDTLFIAGDVHWNEAGHRFVAERITEHLDTVGDREAAAVKQNGFGSDQ